MFPLQGNNAVSQWGPPNNRSCMLACCKDPLLSRSSTTATIVPSASEFLVMVSRSRQWRYCHFYSWLLGHQWQFLSNEITLSVSRTQYRVIYISSICPPPALASQVLATPAQVYAVYYVWSHLPIDMGCRKIRQRDNDRSFQFPKGIPYRRLRVHGSRRITTRTRNTCWMLLSLLTALHLFSCPRG